MVNSILHLSLLQGPESMALAVAYLEHFTWWGHMSDKGSRQGGNENLVYVLFKSIYWVNISAEKTKKSINENKKVPQNKNIKNT